MKKIFLPLMLLTVAVYASDKSEAASSSAVAEWTNRVTQNVDGVRIEIDLQEAGCESNLTNVGRLLPWKLTRELNASTANNPAVSRVKETLDRYEAEVCSAYKEGKIFRDAQIKKMLITIALKESGVKLRVASRDDSEPFQTFFPPYTIVSEGNTDLSEKEKQVLALQTTAMNARSNAWDEIDAIVYSNKRPK